MDWEDEKQLRIVLNTMSDVEFNKLHRLDHKNENCIEGTQGLGGYRRRRNNRGRQEQHDHSFIVSIYTGTLILQVGELDIVKKVQEAIKQGM